MSGLKFLILYIVLMIPTYFWRLAVLGSILDEGGQHQSVSGIVFVLMLLSYLGMAIVAYLRGKKSGKKYLFAFPVLGGVFDLILIFIPFVPTVMNIITIVVGMLDAKQEDTLNQNDKARDEVECPSCAEVVLKKASKCKHCGFVLS